MSAQPAIWQLSFGQPAPLLSMNDRHHWRTRNRLVKLWRTTTRDYAKLTGSPHGPSIVAVRLPVRDSRRRDPHNYYPTVKAIVDGLVDAGIWPDDTPEYVTTVEPVLVLNRTPFPLVVVTITPRTVEVAP